MSSSEPIEVPLIRLRWISSGVRGSFEVYETDSIREAMHQAVDKWFASDRPPYSFVFAVQVDRDDDRSGPALQALRDIAVIEELREESNPTPGPGEER